MCACVCVCVCIYTNKSLYTIHATLYMLNVLSERLATERI